MQIALLAVFIFGVPIHLVINNTVFFSLLVIIFVFGAFYKHIEIAFNIDGPEHPENIGWKYGDNNDRRNI